MITSLDSLESLFSEIEADKRAYSPGAARYPIRCIFLTNFQALRTLVAYFAPFANIVQLSAHLPFDDGWFMVEDILTIVRSLQSNSVVTPLSEVLRFFPDAEFVALITSLFELENSPSTPDKRIYVPLVGIEGRFDSAFFQHFHRKDQWAPVWSVRDEPQEKIRIYQLAYYTGYDSQVIPLECAEIHSTANWLDLWKQEQLHTVICRSASMAALYQHFLPDVIFHPEKITNPKVYLEKIIGLHLPITFSESETMFWDTLIQKESQHKHDTPIVDFAHVMKVHFNLHNVTKLGADTLLSLWFQHTDEFSRWLIKHWVLTQKSLQQTYLFEVMSGITTFSDDELIDRIWFRLFDDDPPSKLYCVERKRYLDQLHREYRLPYHQLEQKISKHLAGVAGKSVKEQFNVVTNISVAERQWMIRAFQQAQPPERAKIYTALHECYPEFYHYLDWQIALNNSTIDGWLLSYFTEYTRSKALHQKTAALEELLNEKNRDNQSFYEWYYQLEQAQLPDEADIVWLDGVGAEWLPLLEYLINTYGKNKNKYVQARYLTKAQLPTITSCNRFESARHVLEFDEYIHQQEHPYVYPDTLIEQIDLLTSLVRKYIIENNAENIAVVSDHGCTFLAQKQFGNIKKYDFQGSEHEGRCMWTEYEYQDDTDFLLHRPQSGQCEGKPVLVALKHTSLYTTPSREVHGGATPEEVAVPYLMVSKIDQSITYHVEVLTPDISVKHPELVIQITPEPPQAPTLHWQGKQFRLEKFEEQWRLVLEGYKAGTYHSAVCVMDQRFDLDFFIQGGFQEKELL